MSRRARRAVRRALVRRRLPLAARADDVGAATRRPCPSGRGSRPGGASSWAAAAPGRGGTSGRRWRRGARRHRSRRSRRPRTGSRSVTSSRGDRAGSTRSRSVWSVSSPVIHARVESHTVRPGRHEGVERGLVEELVGVHHVGGGHDAQVEHLVADADADPRVLPGAGEDAEGQVVDVEPGAGGAGHPGWRCVVMAAPCGRGGVEEASARRPRAIRSSRGSTTEQEPNEVNQRRGPVARGRRRAQGGAVALLEGRRPRRAADPPSTGVAVATSTLRKPWCSKPVSGAWRTARCSPAVHLNGVSRSRAASIQAATVAGSGNRSCLDAAECGTSAGARRRRPRRRPRASRRSVGRRELDVNGHVVESRRRSRARPRPRRGGRCRRGRRGRAARSRGRRGAGPGGRQRGRPGDLAGAAGDHDRQRAGEPADQRQVGVAQHEGADEAGVPLAAAGGVRRGGVVEGGVAGREDGSVVDEAAPGGHGIGRCGNGESRGYSSHQRIADTSGRLSDEWSGLMAHYRAVGAVPPQAAHPAPRRRRAPLLRGADGGGGLLLRLLAALPPRRALGDRRQRGLGAGRPARTPNHPLKPRHLKLHDAARPARARVEGRRLVLGNNDVRISYVLTGTDPSPLYRNAIGDECVYVESGTGTVETVFGVVAYRAGDYVLIPRATTTAGSRPRRAGSTRSRPTATSTRPSATSPASGSSSSTRPTASATCTATDSTAGRAEGDETSTCWSSTARAPASSAPG